MDSTKREPQEANYDLKGNGMTTHPGIDRENLLQPSGNEPGSLCFNGEKFFLAESNKGKQTLVSCGYVYRRDHQGKSKISWRCIRRDCTAQIKTNKVIDAIIEDNGKGHNHDTDSRKMAKQFLRVACKKKAAEDCTAKTQDIITSELRRFHELGYTTSEDVKFLKMAMYRTRRKTFSRSQRLDFRKKKCDESSHASKAQNQIQGQIILQDGPPPSSLPLPLSSSPPLPSLPPSSYFPLSYVENNDQFSLLSHHPETDFVGQNGHVLPLDHTQQVETDAPEMSFSDTLLCPLEIVASSSQDESNGTQEASSSEELPEQVINSKEGHEKKEDVSYFRCYADISIHEEMLKDKIRTLGYRRALLENRTRLKGCTVLDVGAGTGILSHFAIQAGARKVYAVEASSMAVYAEKIAKENNVETAISIIHSKMEDAEIPGKVDAIVSEWMGYNLLYESMLPSVLTARDKYLKPGGEMFPSSAALYLAPINDEEFSERLKTWKQMKSLYGVSMESLVSLTRKTLIAKADSRQLQVESVLANACQVCHFDLKTLSHEDAMQVQSDFNFKCYGHSTVHAFATWFTISFPGTVVIDTSPYALPTHWGQMVLYLQSPFNVRQDSEIFGTFHMKPSSHNHRFWDITLDFQLNGGKKYVQHWQCTDA